MNAELVSSLLGMTNPESLDLELAILLLWAGIDLGSAFSDQFGTLRDFIACRFYELEKEILDGLDLVSGPNCQHFEGKEQIESRAPWGVAGDDTAPFNLRPLHNTNF